MSHMLIMLPPVLLIAILPATGVRTMIAADDSPATLTRTHASAFARLALKGSSREYPNKPGHVLLNDADAKTPRALHPAFYGCYDWHSSVHGHWMLARFLKTFPDLPEAKAIRAVLNEHLTARNIKAEVDVLRPARGEVVRAALRLGVAAEARRGTARLGRSGREEVVRGPETPGGVDRDALRRVLPQADLSDPHRRASQHRVRAWPSRTITPAPSATRSSERSSRSGRRATTAKDADAPGAVGAGRGGLPLAEPVRGRPDAARAARERSSAPGSTSTCPARPRASRRRSSSPRRSPTAPTRNSSTSTA